jgi:ribose transport system substrate-binding protein
MRPRGARSTRIAVAITLVGAMAATSALVTIGTAGAASRTVAAASRPALLPSSVHPPTFNDNALFGLRNALVKALKGKSMQGVNTWEVVNILATYWVAGKEGDAAAAKDLGIAAHYEGPPQGQLATQVTMYETLASTGATGYFTSVIDPVSEGSIINKAVAKGIDVVAIDSPVPMKDAHTFLYLGTPNVTAGEAAGAAMKKALPKGGDVAILTGSLTATNALQRIQGFKAALAGSNIKIVATENDNGAAGQAATNADTVISSYSNLAGIYGVYSYDGPAAAVAVKSKGDVGKIKVVADDNEPGTVTGLENGTVYASIIQQPFMQGYLGAYVTAAMHVLGSAKVAAIMKPYLTTAATATASAAISTGVGTLTKANLAADLAYNAEIAKY